MRIRFWTLTSRPPEESIRESLSKTSAATVLKAWEQRKTVEALVDVDLRGEAELPMRALGENLLEYCRVRGGHFADQATQDAFTDLKSILESFLAVPLEENLRQYSRSELDALRFKYAGRICPSQGVILKHLNLPELPGLNMQSRTQGSPVKETHGLFVAECAFTKFEDLVDESEVRRRVENVCKELGLDSSNTATEFFCHGVGVFSRVDTQSGKSRKTWLIGGTSPFLYTDSENVTGVLDALTHYVAKQAYWTYFEGECADDIDTVKPLHPMHGHAIEYINNDERTSFARAARFMTQIIRLNADRLSLSPFYAMQARELGLHAGKLC
ncbi:hypothetical protein CCB81_13135 [Armatimonadetes bacterium Uphvl-Ar2]|nr:hypothetical protein CCB81_13070 [Armatimonadetes bacterium Uphvl-Ar2]ARU45034.1 hypothetical protein CCB81_13135 [Armatimonadetes bacterium Uphvl-Ar2]